jgi:serine/threonine-protein phosphatase CPPED1
MKRWIHSWQFLLAVAAWLTALPAGRAAEPFFFIQLSDPQFGMFTENRDFAQETANFEFAVASVNRLKPAFVVITGDLIHKPGDMPQIVEYLRISGKIDPRIPVYNVSGNHDVENVPTATAISVYTNIFGPDRYSFRHGSFVGIILNSSVIHSPQQTGPELTSQEEWLRSQLARARDDGAKHIVVFQHHPWFLKAADEPDQYFNIPRERRARYLGLFREFGVKHLFSGHYHQNAVARDGDMEAVTTGPVGKPLGNDRSGLRVVIVRDQGLEHRYYQLGEIPNRIELRPAKPVSRNAK